MSNLINDHESWEEGESKNYALSGKIMLSAIIILFAVVVFMILLHVYARWYFLSVRHRYLHRRRTRRSRTHRSGATHIVFYVDPANPGGALPSRGLDSVVLASLPVFEYKSADYPEGLDCAVCLSEFDEEEKGRILPKCHHSFHTECIDMWFHSHSTCPICRAPVETVPVQNENPSEVALSVGESDPAGSTSTRDDEGSTSLADRRKGMDLVGVRIEVPRRTESMDEMKLSSPASHGFRSPVNRLQSLKRILSMNRKSMIVSPSSGIGPSYGSVGGELDVEVGKCESTRFPTPR